jgi:hypothetical protein
MTLSMRSWTVPKAAMPAQEAIAPNLKTMHAQNNVFFCKSDRSSVVSPVFGVFVGMNRRTMRAGGATTE